jgi:hypothetical protein
MKPRAGNLSDLKSPAIKAEMNPNQKKDGSVKAGLLVTAALLILSNASWVLYYIQKNKEMEELIAANTNNPKAKNG